MKTGAILKLYFDFMRALPPGARQAIAAALAVAGTLVIMWALYLVRLILRAYRETQKRQRSWHPDPEAERREVAELRRVRAHEARAQVENNVMRGRRDALQAREARQDAARNAGKAASVARTARKAAGVH